MGQTGIAQLRISAPGFTPDSGTVTVVPPGYDIASLSTATTTTAGNDPFVARVGIPSASHAFLTIVPAVRAGGQPLTSTLTSRNPSGGDVITLPDSTSPVTVTIGPHQFTSPSTLALGGVASEPIGGGSKPPTPRAGAGVRAADRGRQS